MDKDLFLIARKGIWWEGFPGKLSFDVRIPRHKSLCNVLCQPSLLLRRTSFFLCISSSLCTILSFVSPFGVRNILKTRFFTRHAHRFSKIDSEAHVYVPLKIRLSWLFYWNRLYLYMKTKDFFICLTYDISCLLLLHYKDRAVNILSWWTYIVENSYDNSVFEFNENRIQAYGYDNLLAATVIWRIWLLQNINHLNFNIVMLICTEWKDLYLSLFITLYNSAIRPWYRTWQLKTL